MNGFPVTYAPSENLHNYPQTLPAIKTFKIAMWYCPGATVGVIQLKSEREFGWNLPTSAARLPIMDVAGLSSNTNRAHIPQSTHPTQQMIASTSSATIGSVSILIILYLCHLFYSILSATSTFHHTNKSSMIRPTVVWQPCSRTMVEQCLIYQKWYNSGSTMVVPP